MNKDKTEFMAKLGRNVFVEENKTYRYLNFNIADDKRERFWELMHELIDVGMDYTIFQSGPRMLNRLQCDPSRLQIKMRIEEPNAERFLKELRKLDE